MSLLLHILPPTIHPMIVHFPIAIAFLLLANEVMALIRPRDPLYSRAGLILYVLELASLVAAALAGIVSEHAAIPNATTRGMLGVHQRDAVFTGLAFSAGFIVRALRWLQALRKRRTVYGPSALSLLCQLAGTVLLVVTASIGGSMVYDHGLGVALGGSAQHRTGSHPSGSTGAATQTAQRSPSGSSAPTPTTATLVSQGQQIWSAQCSACHGAQAFGPSFVQQVGQTQLQQFIATDMPPQNPLSAAQARAVVAFLNAP